jgi:hypothetical protein
MKNLSHRTDLLCELVTSLLRRWIEMGEMFKLVRHATWADSLHFLYLLLLPIFQILASSQPTL